MALLSRPSIFLAVSCAALFLLCTLLSGNSRISSPASTSVASLRQLAPATIGFGPRFGARSLLRCRADEPSTERKYGMLGNKGLRSNVYG
eukprot:1074481-Amorphochlora_amoeboformis.AAC.1